MSSSSDSRFAWLRAFLSAYKRSVAIALALGLVASGCAALLMFTSGYLISATAQAGTTLFSVMIPVAFVQLFGLGRPFARYLERLVSHDWVLKITSDLRRVLYRHVARNASDPTQARASGEYLGLLADDIAHLQNLYLRVVFPSAIALLLAIGAAVVFGVFSVPFALIMLLVFAATVVLVPLCTLLAMRARTVRAKQMRADHFVQLTDDILGSTDWILSGRSRESLQANAARDRSVREVEARIRLFDRAMELASVLVLAGAVCATIAWAGGQFGGNPALANWIAAFTLGFFPLIESFALLPGVVSDGADHLESIDRLQDIAETGGMPPAGKPFPAGDGALQLEFRGVDYAYPAASRNAIDGLDICIQPGQNVALVGRSGSGKSTFAALARGMIVPTAGTVVLDGIAIRARTRDMSGAIGFLSQDPYLFNKSLRDNLTMGVHDLPDDQLEALLGRVGLAERFASLPQGLDTVIGETGRGFSGGEAHRIALARVLAADVGLVIVDEPFAALDPATERELLNTLLETCADRTLVVITHHLAQIERFDRVVFLEDGRVVLDGAPSILAREDDRFAALLSFDRAR